MAKNAKKVKVQKRITAQDSVPFYSCYDDGIIETEKGKFSKSYNLEDVNFLIVSQSEQERIFKQFEDLLNTFDVSVHIQLTLFNRPVNKQKQEAGVLIQPHGDSLDPYREEMNQILRRKMDEGSTGFSREKYITLSISADDHKTAAIQFNRLDAELNDGVRKINHIGAKPMTIGERLSILYDIYNTDVAAFDTTVQALNPNGGFSLADINKQGFSAKDLVAPTSASFGAKSFELGGQCGKTSFLAVLPSIMNATFLSSLMEIPGKMLASINFEVMDQAKALKIIHNQIVNINSEIVNHQKRAARSGYSGLILPPDMAQAQQDAQNLLTDMTNRNQKMFMSTMTISAMAEDQLKLNSLLALIKSVSERYLCNFKFPSYLQEDAFNTSLPLGARHLEVQRILTTESAALFLPFSSTELSDEHGIYYGLNSVTKNLITYDRRKAANSNGVILGSSGSGKSFAAKREITSVLLNTDDDVYVIDPEREYASIAGLFDGEVVRVAAGSDTYINPFDMELNYADTDDPITLKSDFICTLCETMIGGRMGLNPIQKSIIDRCVRLTYRDYMDFVRENPNDVEGAKAKMPTMVEFYKILNSQPEVEAQSIALSLEFYVTGSLKTFSRKTNVDVHKRFVVYDIKDIGAELKEIGLQVCLNDIWNRTIANKAKGKRTWFYIDEFHILLQTDNSAQFMQQIFKRARKWGGVPTGITQNVEDLLNRPEARAVLNNCEFIMMLKQSAIDGTELAKMLNISEGQLGYIINSDVGQGLLYTGRTIVPFTDKFPSDNNIYRAITTKVDDLKRNPQKQ